MSSPERPIEHRVPDYISRYAVDLFDTTKESGLTVVTTSVGRSVGMLLAAEWQDTDMVMAPIYGGASGLTKNASILTATATAGAIILEQHIDRLFGADRIEECLDICSPDIIYPDRIEKRSFLGKLELPVKRQAEGIAGIAQGKIVRKLWVLASGQPEEDLFAPDHQPADLAYRALDESMELHGLNPSVTEARNHMLAPGGFAVHTIVSPCWVDLTRPAA